MLRDLGGIIPNKEVKTLRSCLPTNKKVLQGFPGGLVVRIPGFHCCGPGSIPGQGISIHKPQDAAKKKGFT